MVLRRRVAVRLSSQDRGLLSSKIGGHPSFLLDLADWSGLSCDFRGDGGRSMCSLPECSRPVELGHQTLQRSMVPLDRVAVTWAHVAEATTGGTFTQTPALSKHTALERPLFFSLVLQRRSFGDVLLLD